MPGAPVRRVRARVRGTVQGVGFRPFVFRLAHEHGLTGWVLNDTDGVLVDVEGESGSVARFLEAVRSQPPPLAVVEELRAEELEPGGAGEFRIVESDASGEPRAPVTADAATCGDCLRELFDPTDRRYRYPFVNCTNCGPRFTIVRDVPYDRPFTTMAGFEMCAICRAEYEDPLDRRFHAQPNACPRCGPVASLRDPKGTRVEGGGGDALAAAASSLREGRIVAVKGLGGYHLACRADDEAAVTTLRARKHREEKPFALMAPSLDSAAALVELSKAETDLLLSSQRPIVLALRGEGAPIAGAVAPRSRELGVMLPYSPLHHLLLADVGVPLVLTSGNVSDEPIAYLDEDALARLGGIADLFLVHDRPIETRTDDSVLRVVTAPTRRALPLRRSRGYVPSPLALPLECGAPVLACGAELKSTFCVAKGRRAWVSHHIGDLQNFETLTSFRTGVEHFERLFSIEPGLCAHDMHPDYLSTRYALEQAGVETVGVQHHHAHLAACLAEYGETARALGVIFDGTGYGSDGTVWGGELLLGDLAGFERVGHLRSVRMPGGEAAIREPWRMACAWLGEGLREEPSLPPRLREAVDENAWRRVHRLASSSTLAPLTTSAGRLFDAVAALCGIRAEVSYEGQAAIELEGAALPEESSAYEFCVSVEESGLVIDPREAVAAIATDLAAGAEVPLVSARFHNAVAAATAGAAEQLAAANAVETVVLSGGVFQNRLLLERTGELLGRAGLRVLVPSRLPPNDGGISFGQAAVAAARNRSG